LEKGPCHKIFHRWFSFFSANNCGGGLSVPGLAFFKEWCFTLSNSLLQNGLQIFDVLQRKLQHAGAAENGVPESCSYKSSSTTQEQIAENPVLEIQYIQD
jgi:hypothetical protein